MYRLTRTELVAIKGEEFVKNFETLPFEKKNDFFDGLLDDLLPEPKVRIIYLKEDRELLKQKEGEDFFWYNSDSFDAKMQK